MNYHSTVGLNALPAFQWSNSRNQDGVVLVQGHEQTRSPNSHGAPRMSALEMRHGPIGPMESLPLVFQTSGT